MAWIFEECVDWYGSCVRQYIICVLSLGVSVLAIISVYKTWVRQKRMVFELIILCINSITSLIIFGLHLQFQLYNTHIVLLLIEFYSYFLIFYGFAVAYTQNSIQISSKIKRRLKLLFYFITSLVVVAIVISTILSIASVIECKKEVGLSTTIIIAIELPFYASILYFGEKMKAKLKKFMAKNNRNNQSSQHLMECQDEFYNIKKLQINLVMVSFSVSLLLHFVELVLFLVQKDGISCLEGRNQISVQNISQFMIMLIENISELFPHFIIPFIFWYLPANINKSAHTVYIAPKQIKDTHLASSY